MAELKFIMVARSREGSRRAEAGDPMLLPARKEPRPILLKNPLWSAATEKQATLKAQFVAQRASVPFPPFAKGGTGVARYTSKLLARWSKLQ